MPSNSKDTLEPGWLLDLYPVGDSMVLWFLTERGERVRLLDLFQPLAFLSGPPRAVEACLAEMLRARDVADEGMTERLEFWTGQPMAVRAIRILEIERWKARLGRYAERHPRVQWYNADLLAEQVYAIERDVFPLMRCAFAREGDLLTRMERRDDRWDVHFESPPLRIVELSGKGSLLGRRPRLDSLTLESAGRTITWDEREGMLEGLQSALDREDPDVILTSGGDELLLPLLFLLARESNFDLRLDRDPPARPRGVKTEGRSYMSYGKVLYMAPEHALRGRLHLDRANSFMLSQDGIEGLFEVARLARLPVQRIGRRSIGTGITSVQLDMAWRDGYLVPWKKTHPEAWKTARQLLRTDRGGLVYAPEVGLHENVVELDFISMYPSIMSRLNVSPETVNCPCCRNRRVPEIDYAICEKRSGLVSRALAPIIEKRRRYKKLRGEARASGDAVAAARYDHCQDALKWMLVCCFGYLGYRNARFGRIEAHEAVSAWSREILLRTQEICEQRGWHLLHANVDCVWIAKKDHDRAEVDALCEEIGRETKLDIAIEGEYRWIVFLPSRQYDDRPVPSRYFGVFSDGSLKYRGIECRRRDLPVYIRQGQLKLLMELAEGARDRAGYTAMVPRILQQIEAMEGELLRNEIPIADLLFHQSLSQEPDEYRGHGAQAVAARQSARAGLNYHAGEKLTYLITSEKDRDAERRVCLGELADAATTPDPHAYRRVLRRMANTLLWPVGTSLEEKNLHPHPPRKRPLSPPSASMQLELW